MIARDRGFTEREAVEFNRWLDADPRHAAAMEEASAVWGALDRIPSRIGQPIVDRSVRVARWRWPALASLSVAAALALLAWLGGSRFSPSQRDRTARAEVATAPAPHATLLADGTRVRLNVGAEVREVFSASERRVRLMSGEAYFVVTHDATRPFVVQAGDVLVRAVGTAFNVRWQSRAIDVLVTEGKVEVTPDPLAPTSDTALPVVVAGQRAVVETTSFSEPAKVTISAVNHEDIAAALAWHEPLRRLGGVTLMELAGEFERQTGRRLVVADEALKDLQIGGRFPSDNLEELLRLLAENYGIASERTPEGVVVLRKTQ